MPSASAAFSISSLEPWANTAWEGAILDAVQSVTQPELLRMVRGPEVRELSFVLYPAATHTALQSASRLSSFLAINPAIAASRVALCACDLADPDVSEGDIFLLLAQQGASLDSPWAARVREVSELLNMALVWSEHIVKESGIVTSDRGQVSALVSERGAEWLSPYDYL